MPALVDNALVQAAFAQLQPDGAFDGALLNYAHAIRDRRDIVLLAFAPKAAGTYFRQAAVDAIGGQLVRSSHAQGGRDGRFYLPNVLSWYLDDDAPELVTHVHMQALAANRHFIEAFGMKPIIMIRNIPDLLASFWDMLDKDPVARAEGLNCQIPENFVDLARAAKADFLIDIVAPWYASYFATWKTFADNAPDVVRVLRFDEFRANPAETLRSALTHAGHVVSLSQCKESLDRVWSERGAFRFNQGTAGRGKDYFSPAHFEKLSRLLSYYPQLEAWRNDLVGP